MRKIEIELFFNPAESTLQSTSVTRPSLKILASGTSNFIFIFHPIVPFIFSLSKKTFTFHVKQNDMKKFWHGRAYNGKRKQGQFHLYLICNEFLGRIRCAGIHFILSSALNKTIVHIFPVKSSDNMHTPKYGGLISC